MIQKRGKRWRVVVQTGRDPLTGKRNQLSGSAATEREALALERDFRLLAEAGISGRILFRELVAEWWASGPRLAPTTIANYRSNLDNHILPVLGDKHVDEIRPRLVGTFLRRLQVDGMHPATVRKVRTVLSAVMSYAVAMEYAESNPVMKVPPPELPGSERVAPTVEEAAQLLLRAEEDPLFLTDLWVAAEEGGRRGESLALRWRDVDFERCCIKIGSVISAGVDGVKVRGRTKSKKPRTIAVSRITLDHLAECKEAVEEALSAVAGEPVTVPPDAFVFSGGSGSRRHPLDDKPWRPDSTTRRFRRLKERAGVRPEISLHGLRHTMVTELLAAGVDPRTVMGRAGHSSEATTMGIYAKVRPAVDAAAADLWGEMLQAKLNELRREANPDGDGPLTNVKVVPTSPRRLAVPRVPLDALRLRAEPPLAVFVVVMLRPMARCGPRVPPYRRLGDYVSKTRSRWPPTSTTGAGRRLLRGRQRHLPRVPLRPRPVHEDRSPEGADVQTPLRRARSASTTAARWWAYVDAAGVLHGDLWRPGRGLETIDPPTGAAGRAERREGTVAADIYDRGEILFPCPRGLYKARPDFIGVPPDDLTSSGSGSSLHQPSATP